MDLFYKIKKLYFKEQVYFRKPAHNFLRRNIMSFFELFLIAIALSMDAFAVSICQGLAMPSFDKLKAIIIGLWFGLFQGIMPFIGYNLGIRFSSLVKSLDHWIALVLLGYIGIGMLRESKEAYDTNANSSIAFKIMLSLAIATSIDALTIGVTFAFLSVNIFYAILFIGLCTFIISFIGVGIGKYFGYKLKAKSEILGGVILILIGLKIFITHIIQGI